ncbi:hypothetical protein Halha_1621 [Halobacteroides halobius DSM 5150]|uniref:Uncharacterized protein n=1 Tax=Halobacteroides halobius (strain ATCC 35273 / DSM 5150 / MD-1) TaxID=748449 RepID=L0KB10_HALHC|nr:hypothetical protein [Halobacteroides halobius]AGB41559.1 hypothetical protein Halha_1621 [Halobacteroides halobius DSM 5150]
MPHLIKQTRHYLYQRLNTIKQINNCFIRFEALQKLQTEVENSCLYYRMKQNLLTKIEAEIKQAENDYLSYS